MAKKTFDVVVIGAGVIGLSCGYQLAKRNLKTLILEQFTVGNKLGSSHGASRIIRKTQGENVFVQLASDVYPEWDDLGRRSSTQLYIQNGLLTVDTQSSTELRSSLASHHHLEYEILRGGSEISRRFPYFQGLSDHHWAIYEPGGGTILADKCLCALQGQFREFGEENESELIENETVIEVRPNESASSIEVRTNRGRYSTKWVVVAAGSWIPSLVPSLPIRVEPRLITVNYWRTKEEVRKLFEPQNNSTVSSPNLIFTEGTDIFYMIPELDYPGMVKFALHFGVPFDPDIPFGDRKLSELVTKKCSEQLRKHFPGIEPLPAVQSTCVYTMTDDELFVIDHHPKHEQVLIAGGFSGTGFKFGPTVGKIIAKMATDEEGEVWRQFEMNKFSIKNRVAGYKATL